MEARKVIIILLADTLLSDKARLFVNPFSPSVHPVNCHFASLHNNRQHLDSTSVSPVNRHIIIVKHRLLLNRHLIVNRRVLLKFGHGGAPAVAPTKPLGRSKRKTNSARKPEHFPVDATIRLLITGAIPTIPSQCLTPWQVEVALIVERPSMKTVSFLPQNVTLC
jgi:hypothetical protein